MNKQDALDLFGGRPTDAANALGITRQAVNGWPKELPQSISDRVIGAAMRTGVDKVRSIAELEQKLDALT